MTTAIVLALGAGACTCLVLVTVAVAVAAFIVATKGGPRPGPLGGAAP